ncbi:MAG: hypothetical protein CMO49_00360 [Verrucomicrobiales bacterium]|nr:hypothetical protein [Verrucomicrobiales bacterium]|tara:strand:- start:837 stop:2030 length:1194 start_codon:yes stop_codon:yes gene_type:complete
MKLHHPSLVIEIQKAGFINKGAQLMLLSVVSEIRELYPDATIIMETTDINGEQPFEEVVKIGAMPKAHLVVKGIDLSWLFNVIPGRILRRFGLVLERDIDLLIDAAGFAYTSQWGNEPTKQLRDKIRRCRSNGTRIVLLPQAFGPFDTAEIKRHMADVLMSSDLIFARDKVSRASLYNLLPNQENVWLAPDFTNLMKGIIPSYFNPDVHQVCIVPNTRMIDKTSESAGTYIEFMKYIIEHLLRINSKPFILIHESNDLMLANQIINSGLDVAIVNEDDPLVIKGIIGCSKLLIGSRFHSLVSGLSQGIPTIGTGWSHKYQELFEDYKWSEGLISLSIDKRELVALINKISDPIYAKELSSNLRNVASIERRKSKDMWSTVHSLISTIGHNSNFPDFK